MVNAKRNLGENVPDLANMERKSMALARQNLEDADQDKIETKFRQFFFRKKN
jgi:hypothetical protein